MPWLLASPGHQQPCYGLHGMNVFLSSLKKDSNYLCHLIFFRNSGKYFSISWLKPALVKIHYSGANYASKFTHQNTVWSSNRSGTQQRNTKTSLIARFMGPTRGPSGADRTQVGPILAHELCYLGLHSLKRKTFSVGRNSRHLFRWNLSRWQLPVRPVTIISKMTTDVFQWAVYNLIDWLNVVRCTQELITTFSYFLCCTPGTYKFLVYNKENMKTLHRWLCGRPNNRNAGDTQRFHDIAMTWTLWRLRSPTTRPFVQHLDAANNKENIKSSVSLALYKGGIHQWPLDFPHKGKLFHVMTPSMWKDSQEDSTYHDDVIKWRHVPHH